MSHSINYECICGGEIHEEFDSKSSEINCYNCYHPKAREPEKVAVEKAIIVSRKAELLVS